MTLKRGGDNWACPDMGAEKSPENLGTSPAQPMGSDAVLVPCPRRRSKNYPFRKFGVPRVGGRALPLDCLGVQTKCSDQTDNAGDDGVGDRINPAGSGNSPPRSDAPATPQ